MRNKVYRILAGLIAIVVIFPALIMAGRESWHHTFSAIMVGGIMIKYALTGFVIHKEGQFSQLLFNRRKEQKEKE